MLIIFFVLQKVSKNTQKYRNEVHIVPKKNENGSIL